MENLTRRNFVKLTGLTSAALTLGFGSSALGKEVEILKMEAAESLGIELNAWIHIDTNGKVTITNHRSEMGQGSFQSVPQMIAEELEVSLDSINIIFAPGNGRVFGSQVTGGSSTIRGSYKKLMRLGASAREMLLEAAAKKWSVSKTD
ncbi:MAG: molybdopterin cofactor-binding domain-containing protein, partial [Flammeovirgaceae bacterium]